MIPTPLAQNIAPNLKKSLDLINISLKSNTIFSSPESSKKRFRLSMSDMSQTYFIPPLCMAIEDLLDHIKIDILQIKQEKIERIMRVGELDFAIGNIPLLNSLEGKVRNDPLFIDRFVCMIRDGHPLSEDGKNQIDISKLKLLFIKSNVTGHTDLLEKINRNFSDNIVLTIPNYTAAPEIISKTDFGIIIPISIARRYNSENIFSLHEIDLDDNEIIINLYYHELYKDDPSIKWMRQVIIEHFQDK